jgi:hypothetical protein
MVNIKYLIYINGQSIKPLVNSIREAKRHAERHLKYQPSLKIECYRAPITTCIWIYDASGYGADIGAPMAPDVCLVMYPTQGQPDEFTAHLSSSSTVDLI